MGNGVSGKPEAYQLGEWDFYNLTLTITSDVLIPRPDSEHVVDIALEFLKGRVRPHDRRQSAGQSEDTLSCPPVRLLDICCGSGCIGLAIAANCPEISVTYGDISEAALAVARVNGGQDVRLLDALSPPPPDMSSNAYDVLVCNPPYVIPGDPALDMSVLEWEPAIALFGGEDGLAFYRSLLPGWLRLLSPGGLFAVEVGYGQAGTVAAMARESGLTDVTVRKDYAGHERVVYGYKSTEEVLHG